MYRNSIELNVKKEDITCVYYKKVFELYRLFFKVEHKEFYIIISSCG